jgi:hypothetical protein
MIFCYSDTLPNMNTVIMMTSYSLHFNCYKALSATAIYLLFHVIYVRILVL